MPHTPAAVQLPELHTLPVQQAWPAPPHVAQVPLWHASPLPVHVSPAQHTSPAPPQVAHVPALQARPEPVHTSPVQQACPALAPHAVHLPPMQATPLAVQVAFTPVPQQFCPEPPQVPQLPFAHVPITPGHVVPEPTQTLFTQQPPLPQVSPGQHALPAAPHAAHVPLPLPPHTLPVEQDRPVQQACPPPPHDSQIPALQIAPLPQTLPAQHASPAAPHAPASPPLLLPLPLLPPDEPPLLLPLPSAEASPDELPLLPPDDPPLLPPLLPDEPPLLPPDEPPLSPVDASEPPVELAALPPHATTTASAHAARTRNEVVFICKHLRWKRHEPAPRPHRRADPSSRHRSGRLGRRSRFRQEVEESNAHPRIRDRL